MATEASGLVASVNNPDHFWLINDSGNAAKVYLLDKQCKIVRSYTLKDVQNWDWEDMALYYDQSSKKHKIFIGDVGDNMAIRKSINVIEFDEPSLSAGTDTLIIQYKNYVFKYEDHARDAETLIIDPPSFISGTPCLIPKTTPLVLILKFLSKSVMSVSIRTL